MAEDSLIPEMRALWLSLTDRLEVDRNVAKQEFKVIRKTFEATERFYHTLHHVKALLGLIATHEAEIEDPDLLRLAAWYHDVVYDSTRTDNERISAAFAVGSMINLELEGELMEAAEELILRTEGHNTTHATPDEALFLDFDLSILAADRKTYIEYAENIRAEYSWVSEDAYLNGRKQVLQGFLDREAIYTSRLGQQLWETKARENMAWELGLLEMDPE